jgi:hypothetical protein
MNITKREFLVQMGLAKPGRGRLSREAKVALAEARKQGAVFSDDDAVNAAPKQQEAVNEKPRRYVVLDGEEIEVEAPVEHPPLPANEIMRDNCVGYHTDKIGTQDVRTAFEHCGRCFAHLIYCKCAKPVGPSWLGFPALDLETIQ